MRIITHPLAQKEFERQIRWFKKYGYLINFGEIFYNEIQAGLNNLGNYRIGPTPTYSYSLIYKIAESEIPLLAISAPQRRAGYWRRRKI
jgi:hypothetical protein